MVIDPTDLDRVLAVMADQAAEHDRERSEPAEPMAQVRRLRLGAVRLPAANGGSGYSIPGLFDLVIRMAAADPNTTHILRNHFAFVEAQLGYGEPAVSGRWLAEVASGAIFGSASAESGIQVGRPDYGTVLVEHGSGYLLNGVKRYCTGAPYADWVTVLCARPDHSTVTVVIPRDRPGLEVDDDWDGMGQRLSGTCTLRFTAVEVEPEEVLAARGSGAGAPGCLSGVGSFFQLYLTAIIAGIIQNTAASAATVLHGRGRSFTHAASSEAKTDPHLLATVGELSAWAFAARSTVLAAAGSLGATLASFRDGVPDQDLAQDSAVRAAQAKIVVDELGGRAATRLFDVGGASAVRESSGLDRHWRNARTLASHNPAVYKAQAVGDLMVNYAPIPANGFF